MPFLEKNMNYEFNKYYHHIELEKDVINMLRMTKKKKFEVLIN